MFGLLNYQQKRISLIVKKAIFECQVKEIHEKGDASIDDALATKLGFEGLEKLREAVAGQLSSQHAMALRQAVKTNVFDHLAQNIDFDVPPSLLKAEYDGIAKSMVGDEIHDQDHEHGHENRHVADEKLDDSEKAEAHEMALRRVRLGLLLTEIGNKNNITVTDEDTKQAVMQQAYRFPGQEQQVIEHYNNPKNVGSLDREAENVGTGVVGAPECGDVMKLQIRYRYLNTLD